ncbi:C-1-tetrahydrofolate synthase, cytoplasmic isoform X2 [Hydra vulgaris]|uniref:C-1-tetrahydrofolate synthase, cytoplasmic isoform X2 n=1 Tax=Hydra vulgaris TaxID=6087 RepID=A0ABM4C3K6_HYDVU
MFVDEKVHEAQILNGKKISEEILKNASAEIASIKEKHPSFSPGLSILQVGNREDSTVYVGMKVKTGTSLGFCVNHVKFDKNVTELEVLQSIDDLNKDASVHGIIVQLPLDCVEKIDSAKCTNAVLPSKDVDGLNEVNAGRLSRGELKSCFHPCTPHGCMELLKHTGVEIEGKHAVVVGRSKLLGSPMANLLTWANATVTICHSRTKDLDKMISLGDIVIAACGQAEMIKGSWIKQGAIVIDCGINVIPDDTKKSGHRLLGDVEYSEAKKRASWITPVPGGVGPMTVAMLMKNTLESAKSQLF